MDKNDYILRSDVLFELYRNASAKDPIFMIVYRVDLCKRIEKIPAADVEPKRRWIPVTERMPENDDRVLCCTETKSGRKNIVIGYWMEGMWRCGMNSNVIAWMPLPEQPEEEEDGKF